jgi:hypothetical protein
MSDKSQVGSRRSEFGGISAAEPGSVCEADVNAGLHALLIGDSSRAEFRLAVETIEQRAALTVARDIPSALQELARGLAPSLIVVAQLRPGEFSDDQIDALRRAAPLTPIVALLGSLCEGETRNGRPWPGVVRVYWHQWRQQAGFELAALKAGRLSAWSLPATASEEERVLASVQRPFGAGQGAVVVAAACRAMADWLGDACRDRGYSVIRLSPSRPVEGAGAAAVLWDAGLAAATREAELSALRTMFPGAPLLVLVDFPRIEHCERLLAAGAAAVLAKPVLLASLFSQLEETIGAAPNASFQQA